MTPEEPSRIVATWFGVFRVHHGQVEKAYPFPTGAASLVERLELRREGRLAPEELRLVAEAAGAPLVARDRRFAASGVAIAPGPEPRIDPLDYGFALRDLRDLALVRAEADLEREWDPTVHIQEAIHALQDLEELSNTLGERLASWASRDRNPGEETGSGHRRLAEELREGGAPEGETTIDPALRASRSSLAELYLALDRVERELESALTEAVPREAPNLCALLGPLLAARLIDKAGSLERLARLPASTIQVLGAERAFFEHLRGRAPPPRHGLLFLHPRIHSAPRSRRGPLARALAGKVAIAARLDRAGRPVEPSLRAAFEARAAEVESRPAGRGRRGAGRTGPPSGPPLHRAAEDRPLRR
jgi:nucleolar protein 56